jgi:hypothetical protein
MKKLLSDPKLRKQIYEKALYAFQSTLGQTSRACGMCYYIDKVLEAYLKAHNICKMDVNWYDHNAITLCPEIMKHKPKYNNSAYWFKMQNSYIREKILEQAIEEVNDKIN